MISLIGVRTPVCGRIRPMQVYPAGNPADA
jgi:hypothetical protein